MQGAYGQGGCGGKGGSGGSPDSQASEKAWESQNIWKDGATKRDKTGSLTLPKPVSGSWTW